MNKISGIIKFSLIMVTAILLMSCGTMALSERSKKLELGMTKREVLHIMKKQYIISEMSLLDEVRFEVLRFEGLDDNYYYLSFIDDRLVRFEHKKRYVPHHEHLWQ